MKHKGAHRKSDDTSFVRFPVSQLSHPLQETLKRTHVFLETAGSYVRNRLIAVIYRVVVDAVYACHLRRPERRRRDLRKGEDVKDLGSDPRNHRKRESSEPDSVVTRSCGARSRQRPEETTDTAQLNTIHRLRFLAHRPFDDEGSSASRQEQSLTYLQLEPTSRLLDGGRSYRPYCCCQRRVLIGVFVHRVLLTEKASTLREINAFANFKNQHTNFLTHANISVTSDMLLSRPLRICSQIN